MDAVNDNSDITTTLPPTTMNSSDIISQPSSAPTDEPYSYYDHNGYDQTSDPTNRLVTSAALRVYILMFFILYIVLRAVNNFKRQQRENASRNNPAIVVNGDFTMRMGDGDNNSDTLLSLQDRVELYGKAFEKNGNQLTLEAKHIVKREQNSDTCDDGDNDVNDVSFVDVELGQGNATKSENTIDDDDGSIYLSVESARNSKQKEATPDSDDLENRDNSITDTTISSEQPINGSAKSTTVSTTSLRLDDQINGKPHGEKQMISGTCVICFEQFEKDDVIVWSEDAQCNHIYHKECMVNFLASNADRTKTSPNKLDLTNNPCPTCRSTFVHVDDDDLIRLIMKKSAASAPTQQQQLQERSTVATDTIIPL